MKAILCLVFVSCFIGGSLGAGCECFTMKPCVCKHANHYGKLIHMFVFYFVCCMS